MSEAERAEAIRKMLTEGKRYREIAHALGITRNAVSGIVFRHKLRHLAEATGFRKSTKAIGLMKIATYSERVAPPAPVLEEPAPIGPENDFPARGGCQWPHGDPMVPGGRWRMCGHPREVGKPYCPFHTRKAWAPGSKTRQADQRAKIAAASE